MPHFERNMYLRSANDILQSRGSLSIGLAYFMTALVTRILLYVLHPAAALNIARDVGNGVSF
jgi:hypothetical protein